MTDRELYRQKAQAELDAWKAEVDRQKAKASGASAEAQLEMNRQNEVLERKIKAGEAKLAEISEASEDAWESLKDGLESSWDSLRSGFREAASKFKG